jgi:hypothetical protein
MRRQRTARCFEGDESQARARIGWGIEDSRRGPVVGVGTAVAPRVSKLQADQQAVFRSRHAAMLLDQGLAQTGQAALRMRPDRELIGIRAPLVTYRYRLSAPDQFRAATAEPPPSTNRVLARVAVGCPSLPSDGWRSGSRSLFRGGPRAVPGVDPRRTPVPDRTGSRDAAKPTVPESALRPAGFPDAQTHARSSALLVQTAPTPRPCFPCHIEVRTRNGPGNAA